MNLDTSDELGLDEQKTLKVKLPKRLHLKLHSLKILRGPTISETVEEALIAFLGDPESS